jgi:hypothetical protein
MLAYVAFYLQLEIRMAAEVLTWLEEHLDVRNREKQQLGEVFTGLELVDEMLTHLPAAVWRNPDLKWLDPAAGMGNFLLKAFIGGEGFTGLYAGLKERIPDDEARARHIVEKMLYFVDINESNNKVVRRLLGQLAPGAEPNVSSIDKKLGFLGVMPRTWPRHFDVIVGNPPYQLGRVKVARSTAKSKAAAAAAGAAAKTVSVFWAKFVAKSLDLLKSGGHLLFVHPITWFKRDRLGVHDLILANQLKYLKVYRNFEARRVFGGNAGIIHVAYYLLEKRRPHTPTLIEYAAVPDWTDRLMLGPESILIMCYNSIYDKIRRKGFGPLEDADGLELRHKVVRGCSARGTHKLIRIISEDGTAKYVRSATKHPNSDRRKLIISGIHRPVTFYDKSGAYGLYAQGQRHYFLGSAEDLERIDAFFKTKLAALLLDFTKYEQDFIRPGLLPDLRSVPVAMTDAALATYFKFTGKERAAIAAHASGKVSQRPQLDNCP